MIGPMFMPGANPFSFENSRRPEDIERGPASLIDWLAAPEQDSLRRAFVVLSLAGLCPALDVLGGDLQR